MGLTKEVRDFFTDRINTVIVSKIDAIKTKMDKGSIQSEAIQMLEKEIDEEGIFKCLDNLQQRKVAIDAEMDIRAKQLDTKFNIVNSWNTPYGSFRHQSNLADHFKTVAMLKYEDAMCNKLYPAEVKEIETLRKINQNVAGVVLLATTERKLVEKLNAVLQKYGGDIEELLSILPEDL